MGFIWATARDSTWAWDRLQTSTGEQRKGACVIAHFHVGHWNMKCVAVNKGMNAKHTGHWSYPNNSVTSCRTHHISVSHPPHPGNAVVLVLQGYASCSPVLTHAVLCRHPAWAWNTPDCLGLGSCPALASCWCCTDTSWAGSLRVLLTTLCGIALRCPASLGP